uniref:C2H2-type domain-containing protein n=1 Tax=Trichogramma kaykai TaxID=54128 RepID=A0ABD2XN33_9HYME
MLRLIESSPLDKHEFRWLRESAVHHLAETVYEANDGFVFGKQVTLSLMGYFLENPVENYYDGRGYTYFHGACMSGNATAVNVFLSRGVNVNLDSYKYSALHTAAHYRHEEVVEILLRHGADPNKRDAEKSTPLHALTRLCLCLCTDGVKFCDKRKPVDKIVQLLIKYGANIEARNSDGNSPLDSAVSRFDVQLVKSLLEHGASLDSLNEDKMFGAEFTSTELKNYPLALNLIEMIQFLQSVGYRMNFCSRLRMIKCFMRVRGIDTDHLIPELTAEHMRYEELLRLCEHTYDDMYPWWNDFWKRFKLKHMNDVHQKTVHEGRKDYSCDKCEQTFGEKSKLIRHQKTVHEGRKDFACNECEKKFKHKHHMLLHQRTVHEGQKDYACDECEKKFGYKKSLIIHQKIVHEGRKDYACVKCEKKIGYKWLLLRHQKIVHENRKDYACDQCEKRFGRKYNLILHQRTVHEGRKDFACEKCEKKFGLRRNLLNHQKTIHEGRNDYASEKK